MDSSGEGDSAVRTAPLLESFGFEADDAAWLARLRRAGEPFVLGKVGAYELVEEVARGAQGVVFRARQPHTHREIAVKRLVAGALATDSMRSRFAREVEAAAALRHPGIVTVYGFDIVDGQPLLAMEWIDGIPVDRWARGSGSTQPSVASILGLFAEVCDAVHHAHQRGVIHRDLKPSNILVDAGNRPHVLDFGLAKLLQPSDAVAACLTRSRDFVGTPAYAAPEQVRGEHDAVDVRTDVYALGVILYQMLTRDLPHAAENLASLLDSIRDDDPLPPSSRKRALSRELDAIVLRALARERERRYASVEALGADVRRFLAGEPVEAYRAYRSAQWYVLRKTIRRYRGFIGAAVAFIVLLAGSAATLSVLYQRQGRLLGEVTNARDAEHAARLTSERVESAMRGILAATAEIGRGTDLTLRRQLLDEAARRVSTELAGQPEALAAAEDALGRTYQALGLYEEAEPHLRGALDLRERLVGANHALTGDSLAALADLLIDRHDVASAEPLVRRALAIHREPLGAENAAVADDMNRLGLVMQYRQDYDAARIWHSDALAMLRRLRIDDKDVAHTLALLAATYANQGEYASAEPLYREALALDERLLGAEDRETAGGMIELAKVLHNRANYGEAEPLFRKAVAIFRSELGEQNDNVAWGLHRLGVLLHAKGEYGEAEQVLREALAIYRKCFGEGDPYVSLVRACLGTLLMDAGNFAEAEVVFAADRAAWLGRHTHDEALSRWKQNRLGELRQRQASALRYAGDRAAAEPVATEAEGLLLDALSHRDAGPGVELAYVTRSLDSLGTLLLEGGEVQAALAAYREALDLRLAAFGDRHPEVAVSLVNVGYARARGGEREAGEASIQDGLAIAHAMLGAEHPVTRALAARAAEVAP